MVVAEPARWIIELHHEQVGGDQAVEERGRCLPACDSHTQLGVEGVQHRGLDQEVHEVRRQARQDIAQQEVSDRTIRAGERGEEILTSNAALQRDRRQLGTRRPPLRELVQPLQLSVVDRDVLQLQELGQLLGGEPQVVATQARAARRADAIAPTTTAGPISSRQRTGSLPAARR